MPDDPHVSREGSFVLAAETQVNRLVRANKVNRRVIGLLGIVLVLAVAALGFVGYNLYQTTNLSQSVRQGAIQACQNGNAAKHTDQVVFDSLIDTSVSTNTSILKLPDFVKWKQSIDAMPAGPDKDSMEALYTLQVKIVQPHSSSLKQIEDFKKYIAKQYAPSDCQKIYAIPNAAGKR